MENSGQKIFFDSWASVYDMSVSASKGHFPFEGYNTVLDTLVEKANVTSGMKVLDLGTGTGNLAGRFLNRECTVWGIDFSLSMIEKTKAKFPQVHLFDADLLGDWPTTLPAKFERVVSAYVFHEFDLSEKMRLICRVIDNYLVPGGYVLIGDIAFSSVTIREAAAERWASEWDRNEHYWAADEAIIAFKAEKLKAEYQQVSICAGIFKISRIN